MEKIINGIVIRKIGHHIYVLNKNKVYSCKTNGKLKYNNNEAILGDYVLANIGNNDQGIVFEIKERKNSIYRPEIANIDQIAIICSLIKPSLNTYILNKYISFCLLKQIDVIIIFTKIDLLDKNSDEIKIAKKYEQLNFKCLYISNINPDNYLKEIKLFLKNKITVFTGKSGVGKSSLLNNLDNKINLKTQEISDSLDSGKHTTTKSELYQCFGGFIADTPGFSNFNIQGILKNDYAFCFMNLLNVKCQFRNCIHLENMVNCQVKKYFEKKIELSFFYRDYLKILNELDNN